MLSIHMACLLINAHSLIILSLCLVDLPQAEVGVYIIRVKFSAQDKVLHCIPVIAEVKKCLR